MPNRSERTDHQVKTNLEYRFIQFFKRINEIIMQSTTRVFNFFFFLKTRIRLLKKAIYHNSRVTIFKFLDKICNTCTG